MAKSKKNAKRRRKLRKRKGKIVEDISIHPAIKKEIDKLSDDTIPAEEREKLADQLYGEDGKLKPQFYRRKQRKI